MHPGEEDVVANVAELRHPAFGFGQIANGDWDVDDREPLPAEAYRGFCVEVEPAGPADASHGIEQCGGRVDAKAEEGIVDAPPERLQVGPPVGDAPAFDAHRWGRFVEDRFAKDKGVPIVLRLGHHGGNAIRRMLPIGIHGEDVSHAFPASLFETVKNRRAFASVFFEFEDSEIARSIEFSERFSAPIRTAIDDNPDVLPVL